MKRTSHVATLCIAALGTLLADLPATAATPIVNLRAEVQSGRGQAQYYGIKPAEAVPLAVGETVRVALVGTTGNGAQVPVNAVFSVAAGGRAIGLGRGGANWIEVKGQSGSANGLAQLGYRVTDARYTMRGGFTEGRITMQMTSGGPAAEVPGNDGRLEGARRITAVLYRTLLGDNVSSERAQTDIATIAHGGYRGVQQVAAELAREADARRVFAGQTDYHVMGELYRGLLGRTGSDRDLQATDNGFRGSVAGLRRNGLQRAVQDIVSSQEFQSVNSL